MTQGRLMVYLVNDDDDDAQDTEVARRWGGEDKREEWSADTVRHLGALTWVTHLNTYIYYIESRPSYNLYMYVCMYVCIRFTSQYWGGEFDEYSIWTYMYIIWEYHYHWLWMNKMVAAVTNIDTTGIHSLEDLLTNLRNRKIQVLTHPSITYIHIWHHPPAMTTHVM